MIRVAIVGADPAARAALEALRASSGPEEFVVVDEHAPGVDVLISSGAARSVQSARSVHAEGDEQLSRRETEVLERLAAGLANKQIALELGISGHTAKFHISSIFQKLGATNRAEAVAVGVRRGFLHL
jgi:NarL family two-component system response regulator YdfI